MTKLSAASSAIAERHVLWKDIAYALTVKAILLTLLWFSFFHDRIPGPTDRAALFEPAATGTPSALTQP